MPNENINRGCYALSLQGKTLEINMYGQIVQRRPIDWWTGEEVNGDFIVESEFLRDLETYKNYDQLIIHLNSVGGDAYASVAIYNRLKGLVDVDKTIIVDGVAMSGGSLIMCAGDTIQVNPSSIIMIHRCWSYVWDQVNADDLRKMAESFDATDTAQAEIYHARTGMTVEECLDLMSQEKYMSGREAVDLGFATELLEDAEDADVAASADGRTLFVRGRAMRMVAMGKLPEGLPIHAEIAPVPESGDGGDINTPEASGEQGGIPMTFEDFRQENPEAAEALLAEAQATVTADQNAAVESAVAAERQRMAEIDGIASLYDAETVNAAKYTNPCTAQELAFRAAKEMAKTGASFLNQLKAGYQDDGAGAVPAVPSSEEEEPVTQTSDSKKAAGKAMAAKLRGEKTEEV